jgi:hypothetical protein
MSRRIVEARRIKDLPQLVVDPHWLDVLEKGCSPVAAMAVINPARRLFAQFFLTSPFYYGGSRKLREGLDRI